MYIFVEICSTNIELAKENERERKAELKREESDLATTKCVCIVIKIFFFHSQALLPFSIFKERRKKKRKKMKRKIFFVKKDKCYLFLLRVGGKQ